MKSYQKAVSKLVKKSRSYFLLFLPKHVNLINFYNHPELRSTDKNGLGRPKCCVKVKLVKRTKSRLYLEITLRTRPNLVAEIEKSRPFYCRNNAASRMTLLACAACSPTAKAVLQVQDDAGRDVCNIMTSCRVTCRA